MRLELQLIILKVLVMKIDIGNRCVDCKMDTAPGSGRYVNRIPADRQDNANSPRIEGYLCADCQAIECDICHQMTIDYVLNGNIICMNCIEPS